MKTKSILILILVFFSCSFLTYKVVSLILKKSSIEKKREQLSRFSFLDLEGNYFNNQDLNEVFPTLIVYFVPNCDFCQHEMEDLKTNYEALDSLNILLVSSVSIEDLKEFVEQYQLGAYPNFHFFSVSDDTFFQLFGSRVTPSNFLYDKNKQLIKYFKGETKTSTLLKYLKNVESFPLK